MEQATTLLYSAGVVTYSGNSYTLFASDPVGPDGLHIFLQDADNMMAVFLKVGLTFVNGVKPNSVSAIIAALGNPPDISTFGTNLIS
jgi:hypothetical protein